MGFKNRLKVLKFIVPFSVLFLFFQNCTNQAHVDFVNVDLGKVSSITQQNGDGYLGKPPPGDFVRSILDHQCLGSSTKSQIQGRMKVLESSEALITEDNCQDFSYSIPWGDQRWDYMPFNPDFLGLGHVIYERNQSFQSEPEKAVEMFCRKVSAFEGLDVVAKISTRNEASVRLYQGQKNGEQWLGRRVPSFPVGRNVSSLSITYVSENFELTVQTSNPGQSVFQGKLAARIDGKEINQDVICRRMREESAINYSPSGLVGLWQFNGGFLDFSGLNNHITPVDVNGTLSFTSGHYQQSVQLDGLDDYLRINPSPSLNNMRQLTIATWIWPAADNTGSSTHGGIAHKSDRDVSPTQGWQFAFGAMTRALHFHAAFSDQNLFVNASANPAAPLNLETWNHVAVVWDGTPLASGLKFYINGLPAVILAGQNGVGSRVDDSNWPLNLGHYSDNAGASLEGRLDQMSIWNRTLSPAEILNLYRTGSPSP